ncbi:carbohydrate-binding module family 18 protein [Piromyces sp. E2]|nr:carbohydrate-binding module family 18 protein [Piromyces sp. E2]|eukprot:OUM66930.1 carbohydrate-binding module family 18 protein [Piromyces sp. E2]
MLCILILTLLAYANAALGKTEFFKKGKRAEIFELTDNKVSEFRIKLPQEDFELLLRKANTNNEYEYLTDTSTITKSSFNRDDLCNTDNYIEEEQKNFKASDREKILRSRFDEELEYIKTFLSVMEGYNLNKIYPEVNFRKELPQLKVDDSGYIGINIKSICKNFKFNINDYKAIKNPYSEKVRFIVFQSNSKFDLFNIAKILAGKTTFRHYLISNGLAKHLIEFKFLKVDSDGLYNVDANNYFSFCDGFSETKYNTKAIDNLLSELQTELYGTAKYILNEIKDTNIVDIYPDINVREEFPELNIDDDGYANIDVNDILDGFQYNVREFKSLITEKMSIDTYRKLEFNYFNSNKYFKLSNLLIKMAKKFNFDIDYAGTNLDNMLMDYKNVYKNNDGIYYYNKEASGSMIDSTEDSTKDDFKSKNATMIVNIGGKKQTFDKVTFSISGHFSRYYGKPQYKVKIGGGKNLYGRSNFKLRSDTLEPTYLRSKLISDIHNYLELPSCSANYITLYINNEYMGLYILTDLFKTSWIESVYGDKNTKFLYKCDGCNLTAKEDCKCENENEDITDNTEFNKLIKALDKAKKISDVESILDVDQFLTEMAIDFLTGGWDHLLASHNYSLYKPKNGKWLYLSYDFDLDMGLDSYPVMRFQDYTKKIHILEVLILKEPTRFDNIVKNIITKVFNPAVLFPHIDELKELIRPYVKKEYIKDKYGNYPGRINHSDWDLYSYEIWEANSDFTNHDNSQWEYFYGIKSWILERYRFLCSYYRMTCDATYLDKNFKYSINKNVEYHGLYNKSAFANEYEGLVKEGRCGPKFYNIKCKKADECCSSYGYCGHSDQHCDVNQGCQSEFGICKNASTTKPIRTTTTTTTIIKNKAKTVYSTRTLTKTKIVKTTTLVHSLATYSKVSYQGGIGSKYYLGVDQVKEYTQIPAKLGKQGNYIHWMIKNESKPSNMYLANKDGSISNYCLDVGKSINESSYYLTIKKCSNTTYFFKYSVSFTDYKNNKINNPSNIAIYKNANTLFTNENGIPYCIFYDDTLRIEQCKNPEASPNYIWNKIGNGRYTQTSTRTEVKTSTITYTTTTVIPTVIN